LTSGAIMADEMQHGAGIDGFIWPVHGINRVAGLRVAEPEGGFGG